MDSDDDFVSEDSSREEFDEPAMDTDDGSFGEGIHTLPAVTKERLLTKSIDFDDDDDGDIGLVQDKDLIRPMRKAFEVDFKVLSPADIQRSQNTQIDEVSSILGQPPESTAILLRYMRWNKERLIENYMDRPEKVLEDAGLGPNFSGSPKTISIKGFECEICYEDSPSLRSYSMICGHRYCVDCYTHYLDQKIREEGEAARIECPKDGCHRIVDSKSIKLLVATKVLHR